MFDLLLYPYQSPTFSAFSNTGQATPIEAGTTVSGTKTFTWMSSNSGYTAVNSVSISG